MTAPCALLLTGTCGSGKSTVAGLLADTSDELPEETVRRVLDSLAGG